MQRAVVLWYKKKRCGCTEECVVVVVVVVMRGKEVLGEGVEWLSRQEEV